MNNKEYTIKEKLPPAGKKPFNFRSILVKGYITITNKWINVYYFFATGTWREEGTSKLVIIDKWKLI